MKALFEIEHATKGYNSGTVVSIDVNKVYDYASHVGSLGGSKHGVIHHWIIKKEEYPKEGNFGFFCEGGFDGENFLPQIGTGWCNLTNSTPERVGYYLCSANLGKGTLGSNYAYDKAVENEGMSFADFCKSKGVSMDKIVKVWGIHHNFDNWG